MLGIALKVLILEWNLILDRVGPLPSLFVNISRSLKDVQDCQYMLGLQEFVNLHMIETYEIIRFIMKTD